MLQLGYFCLFFLLETYRGVRDHFKVVMKIIKSTIIHPISQAMVLEVQEEESLDEQQTREHARS